MVARENFTFSDLENWLNEHRVTEIECLVPDLTGVARGKILPRDLFLAARGAMPGFISSLLWDPPTKVEPSLYFEPT
jgi:hypothetical protein